MNWYYIDPKDVCELDPVWRRQFPAEHACPGCGALEVEVLRKGVTVKLEELPPRYALLGTEFSGVDVSDADFLNLFCDATSCLNLGQVLGPNGVPIQRLVSFSSENLIAMRGGPNFYSRFCQSCGCFRYTPNQSYWIARQSLTGAPLYQCEWGGLVVSEELAKRIDRKKWKGIFVVKLPVLDEPLDGIDPFPENYFYWDKSKDTTNDR